MQFLNRMADMHRTRVQYSQQRYYCLCTAVGLLALVFLCLVPSAKATTINVPSGQPSIQAGINAANNGDTVLVAPGTYHENINFEGKAITVTSSAGAATTIIDGGATPGLATVNFVSGEKGGSVISGFTIQNGGAPTSANGPGLDASGGGVYAYGAGPTILNNVITNNACNGVYIVGGGALIQGNTISNTQDAENNPYCGTYGTGLVLSAAVAGGGSTVIGNIIENNIGPAYGVPSAGGIQIYGVDGCIFLNNIIFNNVSGYGGVNAADVNNLIFVQNIVYGNTAAGVSGPQAGGLNVDVPGDGPPTYGIIANNTFFNNTAGYTSQVYLDGNVSQFLFANNIVYGTQTVPAISCSNVYSDLSPTPLVVDHNDVFNPYGPAYTGICSAETGANGNISTDPLFANSSAADFHLLSGSPAIGSGDTSVIADLAVYNISLTTDFAGAPRLYDGAIDMGPYEDQPVPNFSITSSPAALTIAPGQSGTSTISIAPLYGFNSSVLFSCSGLPAGTACSFSPSTVTPSGTTASTTLTITASTSASNHPQSPFRYIPVATLAFSLCFVRFKNRRWYSHLILCMIATFILTCVTACGGGSSNSGGGGTSTPESGTVKVTATSGSLSNSTSITVYVN